MPARKESASAAKSGERRLKRSQGFVEEVFGVIRADIMSLRIPPDTRISIDSLARELGVSQTPIREALSMLEATGSSPSSISSATAAPRSSIASSSMSYTKCGC